MPANLTSQPETVTTEPEFDPFTCPLTCSEYNRWLDEIRKGEQILAEAEEPDWELMRAAGLTEPPF